MKSNDFDLAVGTRVELGVELPRGNWPSGLIPGACGVVKQTYNGLHYVIFDGITDRIAWPIWRQELRLEEAKNAWLGKYELE